MSQLSCLSDACRCFFDQLRGIADMQHEHLDQADSATATAAAKYQPSTVAPDTASELKCYNHEADASVSALHTFETISSPCSFDAEIFDRVMFNLIKNPNITSSHLFRADIFYDSSTDASFEPEAYSASDRVDVSSDGARPQVSKFIKHMRSELRPRMITVNGFELRRTIVRQMVPRNTQLDKPLPQTCHFFRRRQPGESQSQAAEGLVRPGSSLSEEATSRGTVEHEDNLVVYVPHVSNEDEIPWYHPKVKALYFLHSSPVINKKDTSCEVPPNNISIHISPFPPEPPSTAAADSATPKSTTAVPQTDRLTRTLQNLLSTIHRHGTGQAAGYQKRVHHDRLIPQSRLQDTYTRLKNTYAKDLLHKYWQEQTDATKGIFEDLGIAAFCIELWKVMYSDKEKPFPGFVDIGCGNGVLSFILLSEGYSGFGFDARSRKTWDAFPSTVRSHLHELVLVPSIFETSSSHPSSSSSSASASPPSPTFKTPGNDDNKSGVPDTQHIPTTRGAIPTHPGLFNPGTFIISNHADELTIWTPLLAYLNTSPFISIPCCSHDLSGARCRFPPPPSVPPPPPPTTTTRSSSSEETQNPEKSQKKKDKEAEAGAGAEVKAAAQGAPKPKTKPGSQPSAYSTLCSAVARLAREVGYVAEEEVLRIPSTRNTAIVGRTWAEPKAEEKPEADTDAGTETEASETTMAGAEADAETAAEAEAEADTDADTAEEPSQAGHGDDQQTLGVVNERERQRQRQRQEKEDVIRAIVSRELSGRSVSDVGKEWLEKAAKLAGSKGDAGKH